MNRKRIGRGCLAFWLCCAGLSPVMAEETKVNAAADDTLVVVKQIFGTDPSGREHVLYQEPSGRIYRLDNIEQAVRDLNSKGIGEQGRYHKLRAVLGDTVFVMDLSHSPRPVPLSDTNLHRSVEMDVTNLVVNKDRVIAVYSENCAPAKL